MGRGEETGTVIRSREEGGGGWGGGLGAFKLLLPAPTQQPSKFTRRTGCAYRCLKFTMSSLCSLSSLLALSLPADRLLPRVLNSPTS